MEQEPIFYTKFETDEYIDDITFIRAMKHIHVEPWHQYDIILDARGYGWGNMIEWADYMAEADMVFNEFCGEVTVGFDEIVGTNITRSFLEHSCKCSKTPELNEEKGFLTIAGKSKILQSAIKICWTNQTNTLRIFTLKGDAILMAKYAETMVRRNFGTEDAMKLGKPIPEK